MEISLDGIFNALNLDVDLISELEENIKKTPDYDIYEDGDSWDIIDNVCEYITDINKKKITELKCICLLFEVYELWPIYGITTHIYRMFASAKVKDSAKKEIWRNLEKFLSSAHEYYRKPVEYVLWVDFFEDQKRCDEAWDGMVRAATSQQIIDRLMIVAGPVPFSLKEPLYDKLMVDERRHCVIAESLAHSHADVYGKIDNDKARQYLSKLKVPDDNVHIKYLKERLLD